MVKRIAVYAGALILVLSVVTMAAARDYSNDILRVRGSAGLAPVVETYAKHFEALNPGKTVVVIGSETKSGFEAFAIGAADVVMSDRVPSEQEVKEATRQGATLTAKELRVGTLYYDGKARGLVSDFIAFCVDKYGKSETRGTRMVANTVEPQ